MLGVFKELNRVVFASTSLCLAERKRGGRRTCGHTPPGALRAQGHPPAQQADGESRQLETPEITEGFWKKVYKSPWNRLQDSLALRPRRLRSSSCCRGPDPALGALSGAIKSIRTTLPALAGCALVCACLRKGRRWQDSTPCCLHSPLCTSGQNPFAVGSM